MKIEFDKKTDVGKQRSHNEDNFRLVPDQNLYMVADGMGGHASGEVASEIAVDTLETFFKETSEDEERTWPYKMDQNLGYEENRLSAGIKLANRRIHERGSQNEEQRGMGTTIVSLLFSGDQAYLGHVGDSRIYRLRRGDLYQVTEDHSLLNDYIKMKDLSEEEIENFPHENVIVRALGMEETVEVDVTKEPPRHNDIYLLCSDGLNAMTDDDEIEEILKANKDDLETACDELIDSANENGGKDNVTVT
ncbi:MAG: Stp1/IreP family PP2C-type Ser/Thr phosphatase, partial [Bradymonadaceae bacterium]